MEFLDTVVQFAEYVIENYGVVIWTILAYVFVAWGKQMKDLYVEGKIDTEIEILVYRLVLAAEEFIVDGDKKYTWVAGSIKKMIPDMDDEEIKVWIDSTVRVIRADGKEKPRGGAFVVSNHNDEVLSET